MLKEIARSHSSKDKDEIAGNRHRQTNNHEGFGGRTIPLGLLGNGEIAEVIGMGGRGSIANKLVSSEGEHKQGRLEDMGIRPGKVVEMLTNGGSGPVLIKIDESRIAVARGMAMKLMVKRRQQ